MEENSQSTQRSAVERDLAGNEEDDANAEIAQGLQRFFIGTFRVRLSKMEAHPDNRELSEENVQRLVSTLRESAQTYFNQMSVCIHKNCDRDPEAPADAKWIGTLPDDFKVLVIEGAHRLRASTLVAEENGQFETASWEAAVYSKGEWRRFDGPGLAVTPRTRTARNGEPTAPASENGRLERQQGGEASHGHGRLGEVP